MSWEPADRDNVRAGATLAFGEAVEPQYRFENADVILSLEADFVSSHPAGLRLVREYAARRKVDPLKPEMNRLYVVEGSPTSTGASADHRLALLDNRINAFTTNPARSGRADNEKRLLKGALTDAFDSEETGQSRAR